MRGRETRTATNVWRRRRRRLFLGPPEINFCRRHLDRTRDGETGLSRSVGETDIRRAKTTSLCPLDQSIQFPWLMYRSKQPSPRSLLPTYSADREGKTTTFLLKHLPRISPNFDPSSRAGKHGMNLLLDRVSYLDQPAPVVCGI